MIVKTGIAEAITKRLNTLKGNTDAVAEVIENNVRRRILKEQLNDPAFYEKMSALLDEIIKLRKAKAINYEEYLRRINALAKDVAAGTVDDTPEILKKSRTLRALVNNLKRMSATAGQDDDGVLKLAQKIDAAIKGARFDDWRDVPAREQKIKIAIHGIVQDVDEVERLFLIVKAQSEY